VFFLSGSHIKPVSFQVQQQAARSTTAADQQQLQLCANQGACSLLCGWFDALELVKRSNASVAKQALQCTASSSCIISWLQANSTRARNLPPAYQPRNSALVE